MRSRNQTMSTKPVTGALRWVERLLRGAGRRVGDGWVTEDLGSASLGVPEFRDYPYRRIWPSGLRPGDRS